MSNVNPYEGTMVLWTMSGYANVTKFQSMKNRTSTFLLFYFLYGIVLFYAFIEMVK